MKLILGLGNPGKKYEKTRHNIGFMVIDALKNINRFPEFKLESKFNALISIGSIADEKIILAKAITYMNLSGEALSVIKNFYKISFEDIIIIYDDKDMEFGKIRIRNSGSSGGHNGIKSIINVIGNDFLRIKVGIANEKIHKYDDTSDFVLSKFSKEELKKLEEDIIPNVIEDLESCIT